ncbi:MAG: ABC transporter ATP-binding protein [Rudaea sp.]|uniref:ABC transporter ATP-binding protein n=1 Tax=Rudaea sp. TaxID=2136325 RepID=UPI0039E6FF2D
METSANASQVHVSNDQAVPLRARGLSKSYGWKTVLRDVSLELGPGSVLGLIGRNGAGKSTLIRALLGLIEVDAGEASVFGEPAFALSEAVKAQIGYVPQQPDALAWMRVDQMFDFVGRFYPRWDKGYVRSMLERWWLPRNQVLAKLSPGERQRVELIRAIASQPQLLVLDEPAAALDPVARRDLLRELALRDADNEGAVLFSTHIVSDLERVATHIAFLHEGRLLLHVPIDDLKERYARLILPASLASQGPFAGEIHRRRLNDGGVSLVIERGADCDWPATARESGARLDLLGLEDLFVEIAG